MPEQESWEEFVKEFEKAEISEEYKPFRPILTRTRAIIGRGQEQDQEGARALFNLVKVLRAKSDAGEDVFSLLDKIAGGYIQPDWIVKGDVKQANRNFIDRSTTQYVTQIVLASAEELNLTAQSQTIPVSIVPVVMTNVQAQELVSKTIFQGEPPILESGFDELCEFLKKETSTIDWLKRYGSTPQDWKPFGSGPNDLTLEELILNALKELETDSAFDFLERPLAPSFRDVITLSEGENRSTLRRMREGCIVILDVISMRHPKLQRAFQQTLLDAYPRTSVLSMAPSEESYDLATKLAVAVQLKVEEMEFLRRKRDPGDLGASYRILEKEDFMPWLSDRLKKVDLSRKRAGAPRVVAN